MSRQPSVDGKPSVGLWTRLDLAADDRDPLLDSEETVAGPGAGEAATSVVGDRDLDRVRCVVHGNPGDRRPCVLEHIRQGLLHDPVAGHIDAGRDPVRDARDVELDRQAGRAHLLGQGLDAPERRLRRPRLLLVVVAQHPEQPAHLAEGLLARALDRVERGTGGSRIAGEHLAPTAGLDDDDGDRVRDDVVELPRDSRPLLGHRCACALVLIALELDRAKRE